MYCPNCGAEMEDGAVFCGSCGTSIGGPADGAGKPGMELAGVGSRFVSCIVDGIILNIIKYIFIGLIIATGAGYFEAAMIAAFISIPIAAVYMIYFFGKGQTPGMMATKIKLIRTDGSDYIGYWHGFLRYIGMPISALVLGLGYIWILIDKNKQGWHDKIADVYVVVAR
ncbi:MAG: RDD family protein [Thermodesulfobacteriota bacterium]|nr:RDD family protein [Thermodesulfobacteriota bacterium]